MTDPYPWVEHFVQHVDAYNGYVNTREQFEALKDVFETHTITAFPARRTDRQFGMLSKIVTSTDFFRPSAIWSGPKIILPIKV